MLNAELVDRLRKQATCVYIAVEKSVADDLSDGLRKAAQTIEDTSADYLRVHKASSDRLEALIAARALIDNIGQFPSDEFGAMQDGVLEKIDAALQEWMKGPPVSNAQIEARKRLEDNGRAHGGSGIKVGSDLHLCEMLLADIDALQVALTAATAERDTSYGTLPVGWANHMGLSHEECACEGEDPNCPACHGTGKVPAR